MTPARPPWADCLAPIGDQSARDALVRLFERAVDDVRQLVADGHEVVVVLVSRRLSCLYEMLVNAGFDGLEVIPGCTVVSDRALEGSVRPTTSHQIVLIDDAIVLGTTLVDLYDDLVKDLVDELGDPASEQIIRDQIHVQVAMIDAERHSEALLDHLRLSPDVAEGICSLSTKQLQQVALEIARCLYRAGRPYFTDFPLVEELELSSVAWKALQHSDRWHVFDVTPPTAFAGTERRSITFISTPAVEQAVRAKGRAEAMELIEGIKVRVYASSPDAAGQVHIRIVPMGLPGAMMVPRLVSTLEAIEDELRSGPDWSRWKAPAQHRLLQMYASSCVLAEFWTDLQAVGYEGKLSSRHLDHVHVGCYFGHDDVPKVLDAFDRTVERFAAGRLDPDHVLEPEVPLVARSGLASLRDVKRWTVGSARMVEATSDLRADERFRDQVALLAAAVPPSPGDDGVTPVDAFWVHRVLAIFGEVDEHLEADQEDEIREMGYEEYQDFRTRGRAGEAGERVVKMGITLRELCEGFAPLAVGDPGWAFAALSLAIDVGNDMGVIVPTTVCRGEGGPVFRQYRSGEMAYATKRPHAELRGVPAEDLDHQMDVYTTMALDDVALVAEQEGIVVRRGFVAANDLAAGTAHRADQIAQSWIGNVTEVEDETFMAYVSSRLDPGLSGPVSFDRKDLRAAENTGLALGDTVIWTVFSEPNAVGRPISWAEVRRLASHG